MFNIKNIPHDIKHTFYPKELKIAHAEHANICRIWRQAGRPFDNNHPAKHNKIMSQRKLQNIARTYESEKSINLQNKLMNLKSNEFPKVCRLLKPKKTELDIPYIDTLVGKYSDVNVLEGFRKNTEVLCSENNCSNFDEFFHQLCIQDNSIIFQLSSEVGYKIPQMTINNLKDIIFKKLKLNKACDQFCLSVEHLRYSSDGTLSVLCQILNLIFDDL